MKFFLHTIILLGLLFTACCKKDSPFTPTAPPTLPPETQTGANTFGCMINGQLWLPKGGGFIPNFSKEYTNNKIYIQAAKADISPTQYIGINFGKVYKDTTLIINNYNNGIDFQHFNYGVNLSFYEPVNGKTGEFHLKKLDTINHIMSGTFWFDAIDTTTNAVIEIRDGRFDLTY